MSAEGSASTVGGINWDAYSHEELYRMLWEDADVGDVSLVAAEWAQHRVALDTHAEVLREQRVALLDGWGGPAAEEAADRLDALAARVEKISGLALAGQVAAQEAADALATARAMMPPPPADPAAPFGGDPASPPPGFAAVPGLAGQPGFAAQPDLGTLPGLAALPGPGTAPVPPAAPGVFTPPAAPDLPELPDFLAGTSSPTGLDLPSAPELPGFLAGTTSPTGVGLPGIPTVPGTSPASFAPAPNFTGMSTPAPAPLPTTSGMGAAFGVVGSANFSFYFGAASADQQKAEAVRAMRTYESSLAGSGRLIDQARGAIPPAAPVSPADVPTTRATATATGPVTPGTPSRPGGSSATGARGGVPWARLLGGGGSAGVPAQAGPTAHGVQLAPGLRAGVLPGPTGVFGTPGGSAAGDHAAARGAGQAAMAPPVGGRSDRDDDEHVNRMPTIDHGLFTVDDPVSPAVIGQTTGAQA